MWTLIRAYLCYDTQGEQQTVEEPQGTQHKPEQLMEGEIEEINHTGSTV